jgi:hypothetical protein
METTRLWRAPHASLPVTSDLTYRAEIVRRDARGRSSIYYDGGEFAPYCVESLVEILRAEAHRPHDVLDVSIEIKGPCNASTVKELTRRFVDLHEPRMHVRISAPGHPGVIIAPDLSEDEPAPVPLAIQKTV